jgi:hypothetical protein
MNFSLLWGDATAEIAVDVCGGFRKACRRRLAPGGHGQRGNRFDPSGPPLARYAAMLERQRRGEFSEPVRGRYDLNVSGVFLTLPRWTVRSNQSSPDELAYRLATVFKARLSASRMPDSEGSEC